MDTMTVTVTWSCDVPPVNEVPEIKELMEQHIKDKMEDNISFDMPDYMKNSFVIEHCEVEFS